MLKTDEIGGGSLTPGRAVSRCESCPTAHFTHLRLGNLNPKPQPGILES